ncbi:MAG: hypothetical protein HQK58_01245 [Deltaproteobacteria bacterium]|nr:hypothetical protein [Deltaproteobacteria bacterium]
MNKRLLQVWLRLIGIVIFVLTTGGAVWAQGIQVDGVWRSSDNLSIFIQNYTQGDAICILSMDGHNMLVFYDREFSGEAFAGSSLPSNLGAYYLLISFSSSGQAQYSLIDDSTGKSRAGDMTKEPAEGAEVNGATDGIWQSDPVAVPKFYFQRYNNGGAILLKAEDATKCEVFYDPSAEPFWFQGQDIYAPHQAAAAFSFLSSDHGQVIRTSNDGGSEEWNVSRLSVAGRLTTTSSTSTTTSVTTTRPSTTTTTTKATTTTASTTTTKPTTTTAATTTSTVTTTTGATTTTLQSALYRPQPIAPAAKLTNITPDYIWAAVSAATGYRFQISNASGIKIDQSYSAAEAKCPSGTGTCSVTPNFPLSSDNYKWSVQAVNGQTSGPWSEETVFSFYTTAKLVKKRFGFHMVPVEIHLTAGNASTPSDRPTQPTILWPVRQPGGSLTWLNLARHESSGQLMEVTAGSRVASITYPDTADFIRCAQLGSWLVANIYTDWWVDDSLRPHLKAFIDQAAAAGLKLIVRTEDTTRYSSSPQAQPTDETWFQNRWTPYVTQMVQYGAGKVWGYQIWNEAWNPSDYVLGPTGAMITTDEYVRNLSRTRDLIKNIDPNAAVVMVGLTSIIESEHFAIAVDLLGKGVEQVSDYFNFHYYPKEIDVGDFLRIYPISTLSTNPWIITECNNFFVSADSATKWKSISDIWTAVDGWGKTPQALMAFLWNSSDGLEGWAIKGTPLEKIIETEVTD